MPTTTDYTKSFNPKDKEDRIKDPAILEKCVTARTKTYADLYDYDLWDTFRDDFALWNEDILSTISRVPLIELRDTLRTNGVFAACNQSVVKCLTALLAEPDQHEWTESEVIQHIRRRGTFNSPNIEITYGPTIQRLHATNPGAIQQVTHFEQPDTPSPPTAEPYGMTTRLQSQLNQAREVTPSAPPAQQSYNPTTPDTATLYKQAVPTTTHSRQTVNTTYTGQDTYYGVNIGQLRKAYSEDLRYGNSEDTFDFSYRYFLEMCSHMGIHTQDAQRKAFFVMLKGEALRYYFDSIHEWTRLGIDPISAVKGNFENEEHLRFIQSQWDATNLASTMSKNPDRPISECLEIMLRDLQRLYSKIRPELRNDVYYHSKLISATRLVPACHAATGKPSPNISSLIQDLRSSVNQWEDSKQAVAQHPTDSYYTDRRYYSRQSRSPYRGRSPYGDHRSQDNRRRRTSSQNRSPKKCFVCGKPGCWSTNHTLEEREKSRQRLNSRIDSYVSTYIATYEGRPDNAPDYGKEDIDETFEGFLAQMDTPSTYEIQDHSTKGPLTAAHYFTTATPEHPKFARELATDLANRSATHYLTSLFDVQIDLKPDPKTPIVPLSSSALKGLVVPEYSFLTEGRYSANTFVGVLIDTGAAEVSTAGYAQYLAYRRVAKGAIINLSTAGQASIQFGAGDPLSSIGSIDIETPIGNIRFHIVEAMTPFLLSLKDMDRLGVYFNNTKNMLIGPKPHLTAPIVRRFGHPFLIWDYSLASFLTESFDMDTCFLTSTELRRLHRRFGHPSVERLQKLLTRAGHDVDTEALKHIKKFCHHCQSHGRSPGRFRFTLQDDINFNHSIIVDIMYINGKPVLHVVDEATRFNAARWLDSISAKTTWDVLRMIWIDTYLGPPDFIVTDAGKNFTSKEFKQNATSIGTIVTTVPVEAHWSIGTVERYHAVLRRSYEIVKDEIPDITPEMALQMAVKAINDTAGPDGLVPTLLLFGAYPRMTEYDPPAPTIAQRAAAVKKAMSEVRKLRAQRQVAEAINTRNGPSSTIIHRLPLNSDVLVWREGKTGYPGEWTGPYKLLGIEGETCTIDLPYGPTEFRSTSVKPYHKDNNSTEDKSNSNTDDNTDDNKDKDSLEPNRNAQSAIPNTTPLGTIPPPPSVVIPQYSPDITTSQRPQRHRRLPARYREQLVQDNQFDESRRTEVNGLLERGVFATVEEKDIPPGSRIFTFRFVDEVKNAGTDKAYEKSRLVVQAYNDKDKVHVLTQSPTIQRASQRLILCTGVSKTDVRLYIRDVTQAYIQSTTLLNRDFYIRIPPNLAQFFPGSTFLKVVRPLYGIPEAGNHWFRTYHGHHTEKLGMETSTYDPCLLHCSEPDQGFGIVGMQTDDTLIVADNTFAVREEEEIQRANILCKPREQLTSEKALKFNGAIITEDIQGITLTQERTVSHIRLVQEHPADATNSRGKVRKNASPHEQYVAQRALGAYIASMSQPEASFDLSIAAQTTDPTKDDIKALNKRLQWQLDNPNRGLRFVPIDLRTARLIVFVDASFANNRDYSSQIGYVIVLADGANNANILHWSSTKCKRITRSVLASEVYGMAHGFDAAAAIKSTLTQLLHLTEPLPLVICTDSKSLYECLVKLGTTQEKRLMIDLMCLRQSYERQEIAEVRWIHGDSNPADAMTKGKPCRALQDLIDTNELRINVDGWVERSPKADIPMPKAVKFATPLHSPNL